MASHSFGHLFRITTWGESHGPAIGVIIDGCPSGLILSSEEIQAELEKRRPGNSPFTSPRNEKDAVEIMSGVFEGKTTGAPIALLIANRDVDSSKYEPLKNLLRPGHADMTYRHKYGHIDWRGGGRASARETAARVAAGAIAKKLLAHFGIALVAYIKEIGGIEARSWSGLAKDALEQRRKSALFCLDAEAESKMIDSLEAIKKEGDSLGGVVELLVAPMLPGLGDPVYEKLSANLAKAMMTIPATKGFEIGEGFTAARIRGSTNNDPFLTREGEIVTATNHAGGILGGISTGMPLVVRVAFKPTSSIAKPQQSVSTEGKEAIFQLPEGSRHDPCVAIRAVPVVEAMGALVLADALLLNHSSSVLCSKRYSSCLS